MRYYFGSNIELGNRFMDAFKIRVSQIKENPEMFQLQKKDQRRAVLGSSFPYNIYYHIDYTSKTIEIAGIFHQHKQPEKIKEEIQLEQLHYIRDKKRERYLDRLKSLEQAQESLEQSKDHDLGLEL